MAEKKEKGNNGFKIIIIVLLVLIVFALGFVGFLVIKSKGSDKTANSNVQVVDPGSQGAAVTVVSTYSYSLDEFLVNLADDGGKKFFKVKMFIGYESEEEKKIGKELEEKKPILRDAVNSVLRSKKSSDITTQDKVDALKKEIINKLNPYLKNGKVNNIYFYDILVQ